MAALSLVALLVLLAVLVAWVALDALRARDSLEQAARGVSTLQTDAVAGRTEQLDSTVTELQRHAADAKDATGGPHWSLAGRLPGVGPTVEAVATMATVVDGLARGPLPQLAEVVEVADPATFAPHGGRVDLRPLEGVAPDVVRADQSVAYALQRVEGINRSPVLPQVSAAVSDLEQQLADLRMSTATAARAARLIPPMLGADGPRDYLVLVQNNAEPRALGGIVGTVLVLHADRGRIELTEQMPASQVGPFKQPPAELTEDEQAVFGDKVGRWMQNVTSTPDFPRAAEIARAMWARETGQTVDGVLAVDPAALAEVLKTDGPVAVGSGERLLGEDLVSYLVNGIYLTETPDGADLIFADVAESAFASLSSGSGEPSGMVDALAVAARQGRLLVWSADRAEADLLEGTVLDGGLRGVNGSRPVVGVFTHGLQMAKIGYYLDTAVDVVERGVRSDGARELDVTVTYTSRVDESDAAGLPDYIVGRGESDPGLIRLRSIVYAPAGGAVVQASENSEKIGISPQKHDELQRVFDDIELHPGETASVTYAIISGKHQDGDVILRTTPGPRPVEVSIRK
ncbi:DUF4012 domain-containing protein [Promicromonospora iranensis]|uniref:DUF4012 domain-containing protein n=1 Tax=Promicromonospora iranensis TaxID=1105144 RepID=UPI0023A9FEE9|nr:DUF4012 domain-containing protein [Promicromonospora iranensis]